MLGLNLKKVAVTGAIASGKSTACRILKELGAYVISADEIVHQLLIPESELGKKIINLLGQDVVIQREFNRQAIAQKVFNDNYLLQELEKLLHPEVKKTIEVTYKNIYREKKHPLFVAEIPLLFEGHFEKDFDAIILIYADEGICRKRFINEEDFAVRTKRLIPIQEKIDKSDFVINNSGSLDDLEKALKQIYFKLIK